MKPGGKSLVFSHVICQCAKQQSFHLLTDIYARFLSSIRCWYLALNLTHYWMYKGIRCIFLCVCVSFLLLLELHWCSSSSAVSCLDNESLSLHLAISCFAFSTPMIQLKEFIKGVKCLVIIRGRKTNLVVFDHRDLSHQPVDSVLSSVIIKNHPLFLLVTSLCHRRMSGKVMIVVLFKNQG